MKALNRAGFRVVCYSYIHWRVFKPGSNKVVDVWPTAGKYMALGESGASHYKDIAKDVAAKFETTLVDPTSQHRIRTMEAFRRELNAKLESMGLLSTPS